MTHVSPWSASAKGFTYPDHSLESRRPKPVPPASPLFEPLTAPPDEEKGRKFRSTSSSSSLRFSPTPSLGQLNLGPAMGGEVEDGDGLTADLWLGLARGGADHACSGLIMFPPVGGTTEAVQDESTYSGLDEWSRRIEEMVFDPSQTSLEIRNTDVGLVPDSIWELSTMRRLPTSPATKRAPLGKIQSAPPNQLNLSASASPSLSAQSPPPSPARHPSSPATPTRTGLATRRSFGRTGTGSTLFGPAKVESAPPIKIYLPMTSLRSENISPELWAVSNLAVLSLRNNQLTTLSPGVGRLADLVELNLANNRLEYLPAEVTQLDKLSNLTLHPNRWLPPPPDPHMPTARPSPPLELQVDAQASLSAPDSSGTPRPRLLGEVKVNFKVPTLREMCTRKLLSPGHPPPSPTSSPSRPAAALLPSLPVGHANPKLVIESYYDGSKDWAQRNPHLAEPFLSTLYPHGRWRSTFAHAQVFDPRSNVCTSPAHECEDRVFREPAVERVEWVTEASLKHRPDGEWASSTRSLQFGTDVGPRKVPLLWRGCGRGCLDWLEEVEGDREAAEMGVAMGA